MEQNQFIRKGNALVNTNVNELDKYYEQRRAIQNRQAEKEENTSIREEIVKIRQDLAELKQLIQEIKNT